MANPQKENGYVKIANEIMDAFCRTRIGGEKSQVLDCIIRQTYGYNKKSDMISLSQFCEWTQMPKANVCRAVRQLRAMKIIHTKPAKIATEYSLNKNYEEWENFEPYDREKIFKEEGYRCHICHLEFEIKDLEVDHVIPLWQNGSNKRSNLATSCRKCNRQKGVERIHNFDTVAELTPYQNEHPTGVKIATKKVAKLTHTKDNTKDNIQKTGKNTPANTAKLFFKGVQDLKEKVPSIESDETKIFLQHIETMYPGAGKGAIWAEIKKFCDYWTELNSTGTKQRWQKQDVFQVDRRLSVWFGKIEQFKRSEINKKETKVGKL